MPEPIRARPAGGARDFVAMYDLAAAHPDAALHLADLPWRFSSPAARAPASTRLWETADGALLAWALLSSWNSLQSFARPGPHAADLASAALAWAVERQRGSAAASGEKPLFSASARHDDAARIALVERYGFVRATWHTVHLTRDLHDPVEPPALPEGFVIRPLDGAREVEAYVAMHRTAFGTTFKTAEGRRNTLSDPHYVPELDLVAVAPDGTLAGFCVCWITPPLDARGGARVAQVEPMGVQPAHRRLGLGRALLREGFRRTRALGADRIDVDTYSTSQPALRSYESVGFRRVYDELVFVREPAEDAAPTAT
jgi:mycothiol synthase